MSNGLWECVNCYAVVEQPKDHWCGLNGMRPVPITAERMHNRPVPEPLASWHEEIAQRFKDTQINRRMHARDINRWVILSVSHPVRM